MAKSPVTSKNFKRKMNVIDSCRDTVQQLLAFALVYLADENNPLYLSLLRNKVKTVHGLNVGKLEAYITAHSNVKPSKNKNGEFIYKLPKGAAAEVTMPEDAWYNYEKPSPEPKLGKIDKLRKYLDSTSEGKKNVDVETVAAAKLLAAYMQSGDFARKLQKELATDNAVTEQIAELIK